MSDLVVLCPDIRWRATLEALLQRHEALKLKRHLQVKVFNPPGHTDGGVRVHATELLASYVRQYKYAMVIIDYEGCGSKKSAEEIQESLKNAVQMSWGERASAFVVEPELEAWMIGGHRHFSAVRRLEHVSVRDWLAEHYQWKIGAEKPADPKTAVEAVFRHHGARPSSANYRKIAARASLRTRSCRCSSFQRFVEQLQSWFG